MTFEEWSTAHLLRGSEDFSKRGTPTHLYGCSRECLREAWHAAEESIPVRPEGEKVTAIRLAGSRRNGES